MLSTVLTIAGIAYCLGTLELILFTDGSGTHNIGR